MHLASYLRVKLHGELERLLGLLVERGLEVLQVLLQLGAHLVELLLLGVQVLLQLPALLLLLPQLRRRRLLRRRLEVLRWGVV